MIDIKKYLKKQKWDNIKIEKFLNTPMDCYFNLSTRDFYKINPKKHKKIILDNLKGYFFGEIMGA